MQIKLKPLSLAIIILIVMFGGIAVSNGLNYWATESSKVPAKYTSGEFEGSYNPADIRGSYSFQDISKNFEIPLEHLANAFELSKSENAEEFQCKELEAKYEAAAEKGYEIGTESVKIFVALYKGLPIELTDSYIPASAYQVLRDNADLTQEQIDYLDAHTVDLSMFEGAEPEEASDQANQEDSSKTNEQESSNDRKIKGNTTFGELLSWGITKEEIKQIIKNDMPNTALSIRDYCTEQGVEFSIIKSELQNILDNNN